MRNEDRFLAKEDYDRCFNQLKYYVDQQDAQAELNDEQFLRCYDELLTLRARRFPMLLREGEPHYFDKTPVSAYLLPPLKGRKERWLLAAFVTDDPGSLVQLLTWQIEQNIAVIKPLCTQDPQPIPDCKLRLDLRPSEMEATQLGDTCYIHVAFPQGVLDITATAEDGIRKVDWRMKAKDADYIVRCSWNGMMTAVRIGRYKNKTANWQDDIVHAANGAVLLDNGGRIHGADSPQLQPNLVYLASGRAKLYRVDTNAPTQVMQSNRLADEVLDVVALPWPPDAGAATEHRALASMRSGTVHLFQEDKDKPGLRTPFWQYTGNQIWRLIGRGDQHILSLDERGVLIPLRLLDPVEYMVLRKSATDYLITRYALSEFTPSILSGTDADFAEFPQKARLALEFFILHSHDQALDWRAYLHWWQSFNTCYAQVNLLTHKIRIAELHGSLVKRMLRKICQSCFQTKSTIETNQTLDRVSAVDVIW
ncbi:MAG: hypothetical protein ABL925_05270, partial [Methylococcales bacterium]